MGLTLLGSPLGFSGPSVATYDLLTSLEGVCNPCDVAKFRQAIIELINSKVLEY